MIFVKNLTTKPDHITYVGSTEESLDTVLKLFDQMKTSRCNFKKALKYCKNNEKQICKQKLAEAFVSKEKHNYWREIKKLNFNKHPVSCNIDNESNHDGIVNIFWNKYKSILDNANSQVSPPGFEEEMQQL